MCGWNREGCMCEVGQRVSSADNVRFFYPRFSNSILVQQTPLPREVNAFNMTGFRTALMLNRYRRTCFRGCGCPCALPHRGWHRQHTFGLGTKSKRSTMGYTRHQPIRRSVKANRRVRDSRPTWRRLCLGSEFVVAAEPLSLSCILLDLPKLSSGFRSQ